MDNANGKPIWDSFLTDQDKHHVYTISEGLGRPYVKNAPMGRIKPALLMVDLYRAAFGDRREPLLESVLTWPMSCGESGWDALPAIQELLSAARRNAIPVIHITANAEIPWFKHRVESGIRGRSATDASDSVRYTEAFTIIEEVAPRESELVIKKAAPSAFWGSPLAGHLNYIGIDTVVVAGESTSGCVRATVVDGASYGYNMIVAEECVFDRHEAPHALSLFDMNQKYARVMTLSKIVASLDALGQED
jgi:maleamate amidohydrolase